MKLKIVSSKDKGKNYDIIILPVFKEKTTIKEIEELKKSKQFEANESELFEIEIKKQKFLLIGSGELSNFNNEKVQKITSIALRHINSKKFKNVGFTIPNVNFLKTIIETSMLCLHPNDLLKNKDKKEIKIQNIDFVLEESNNLKKYNQFLNRSKIITGAVNWTKDLVNLPSNIATPEFIVKETKKRIKSKIKILGREEIKKEKLNLIEAVSRTSKLEPKFMIIEYKPKNSKNKKPYCIIGKGITFDTGGISLKPGGFPGNFLRSMKCDMAGAASVIGAIKAIEDLKLPYHVICITPLCENSIGGNAYRVDDVIKAHNGKTVEIVNTDAEGRLVLADSLSYSKRFKPEFTLDIATLTGASSIVLGDVGMCFMSNDDKLAGNIEIASLHTNEKVWQLPFWEEYDELIKSDIADIINVNEGRGPGVIVGGVFLKNFVEGKWVHFDIGSTAFITKDTPLSYKGATGRGVRLIIDLIENYE